MATTQKQESVEAKIARLQSRYRSDVLPVAQRRLKRAFIPGDGQEIPEPVSVIRERRWNKATRQYEWVEVTAEMVEADRRRGIYITAFNIYA